MVRPRRLLAVGRPSPFPAEDNRARQDRVGHPSAKRDASEDRAETTAVLEIEIVGLPDSEIIFATALAIGAILLGVRGRSLCSTTEPPPLVFQAD